MSHSKNQIAVIGAGSVGAAVSYALMMRRIAAEILLVDIDVKRAEGEVADLADGGFVSNCQVRTGTPQEAGQADIIVITAGAKQREGESRVQLIDRNFNILKSVIGGMQPLKADAKLVIVANPCDILTYFAQKLSGLAECQVFGSGTFLDSARLRNAIAKRVGVADTAVHAYVLGEHGDSQFVAWSCANIACTPLLKFKEFESESLRQELADQTKNKAYEIIKAKGATYFGIGAVVSSICESVFMNQKHVRPLSVFVKELGVCLSVPCVLGDGGIKKVMPLNLDAVEMAQLKRSAASLYEVIKKYEPALNQ